MQLGRLRECMEFAVANEMIHSHPCIVIQVPWTDKRSKEEIALTQDEQNMFLSGVEDSWYKEMFYFLCLTGVRVGELVRCGGRTSILIKKSSTSSILSASATWTA